MIWNELIHWTEEFASTLNFMRSTLFNIFTCFQNNIPRLKINMSP